MAGGFSIEKEKLKNLKTIFLANISKSLVK